jgi:hypothetical protein
MMCIPNWSQSCHELLSWLAHLSMHQTHQFWTEGVLNIIKEFGGRK